MFTIEQIKTIHSKVKSGADFPAYVQELKALGLTHYNLLVKNGKGVYYGADGFKVESIPAYIEKTIAEKGDAVKLKHTMTGSLIKRKSSFV